MKGKGKKKGAEKRKHHRIAEFALLAGTRASKILMYYHH